MIKVSLLDRAAVARNEGVRQALTVPLRGAAYWVRGSIRRRIRGHARQQARLRARLGLRPSSPILTWGEETQRSVEAWAAGQRGVRWAETSGSTARPKRLPFTRARLKRIKRGSWEAAVQAGRVHGVRRPTMFVLAALKRDASLSSLMLETPARTSYLEALVMPSKLLWEPAWSELLDRYGPTACRLYLLVLCNPGFVYSTNPSTLAVFLSKLESDWDGCAALVRDVVAGSRAAPARSAVRRVGAPGWLARARRVAESPDALPVADYLDGLRCYACWDGGYVTPFLERIRAFLPAPRFAHVPMFSMATETVQTQTYYGPDGRPHFLPLAPGVLYEFLPADRDDDPERLLGAGELEPGASYCLVVSDIHGLRRYQTGDVFLCQERVLGLPDLRFQRRRGLAYSFTGEKLTGLQVQAAFQRLRDRFHGLGASGAQLTLVPFRPPPGDEALPHYRLVVACPGRDDEAVPAELGQACDAALASQNQEWAGKQSSGRLGPTQAYAVPYDTLAHHLGGGESAEQRGWETQFKLLPLYTRTWEELGLPDPTRVGPGVTR
jgi:hypothetical protein